jgi:hypothetical protein
LGKYNLVADKQPSSKAASQPPHSTTRARNLVHCPNARLFCEGELYMKPEWLRKALLLLGVWINRQYEPRDMASLNQQMTVLEKG